MNKPLILVVEDDPAVARLISTTLETRNYQYHRVQNGAGALLEAASARPDVILLDLGLPDMDGIGENMITAKSDPVFGGVYKLAAVKEDDGSYTPKMKLSESVEKMTIPCLKKVWRIYDEDGKAQADLITMADEVVDTKNGITLFDPIETWKECTYVNSTARCISTRSMRTASAFTPTPTWLISASSAKPRWAPCGTK